MPLADTGISSEAVVEAVAVVAAKRMPIAAGQDHCLALTKDGTKVEAWGMHDCYEQCTIPEFGGLRIKEISAGGTHSLALMEDHTVRAWGKNDDEQCTVPDFAGVKVIQIAAGYSHSLALMEDH
eukprot:Hpha_TRINITY_DN16912_c3_g3::TRINITY_DN16912_c3_g3_i1::g.54770::m.54770